MSTLKRRASVIFVVAISMCPGCTDGDAEKFEKIDLKEIYSTNGQKGLKEVTDLENKFAAELMEKSTQGTSNVFLVQGKDISEAIKETHRVVFAGANGDRIESHFPALLSERHQLRELHGGQPNGKRSLLSGEPEV